MKKLSSFLLFIAVIFGCLIACNNIDEADETRLDVTLDQTYGAIHNDVINSVIPTLRTKAQSEEQFSLEEFANIMLTNTVQAFSDNGLDIRDFSEADVNSFIECVSILKSYKGRKSELVNHYISSEVVSDEMQLILSEFFNGCIESNQLSSGDFEKLYREKVALVPPADQELLTIICGIGESSYDLWNTNETKSNKITGETIYSTLLDAGAGILLVGINPYVGIAVSGAVSMWASTVDLEEAVDNVADSTTD